MSATSASAGRRYRPPAVLLDEAGELGAQPALENRDRLAFQ